MNWRKLLFWRKCGGSKHAGERVVARFPEMTLVCGSGNLKDKTVLGPADRHECLDCGSTWWTIKECEVVVVDDNLLEADDD